MANEVKWIKLDVDMFDNAKIKKIRRLPDGNNILLIWIMLLTMAGKCNAGGMIHITDNVLYTAEDLADELDFSVDTVHLALSSLEKLGMIILENGIAIKNWKFYQAVDGMDKIREQNRIRKQNQREREKLLIEDNQMSRDNHVTVTQSSISISSSKSNSFSEEIKEIIDYLNLKVNKRYTYNNKSYNSKINARLKEGFTVDDFKTVIDKKCDQWLGGEYEQYLTPDTLFAPSKFEKYLNQTAGKKKTSADDTQGYIDKWRNV